MIYIKHEERIRIVDNADTAVLFLHGIVGSPHHFEEFYTKTPDNISYHAILLAGHGAGVLDFGRASMDKWKEQVESAVNSLLKAHDRLVIVGHSMGTLFAIQESIKHRSKITRLLLIDSPMKAYLHPIMLKYSLQFLFGKPSKNDPRSLAAFDAVSVHRDLRLWRYLYWIPRFLELFAEIRRTRRHLANLSADVTFYQSKTDELVPFSSIKYITPHPNLSLKIMENSTHFYYEKNDMNMMLSDFEAALI